MARVSWLSRCTALSEGPRNPHCDRVKMRIHWDEPGSSAQVFILWRLFRCGDWAR